MIEMNHNSIFNKPFKENENCKILSCKSVYRLREILYFLHKIEKRY